MRVARIAWARPRQRAPLEAAEGEPRNIDREGRGDGEKGCLLDRDVVAVEEVFHHQEVELLLAGRLFGTTT
jgi:hypothetical protein